MSIFDIIYKYNLWGNGSGTGSLSWNNKDYILFLQKTLKKRNIKKILEIGCGDYRLWKDIDYDGEYIGIDIVDNIIIDNYKFSTDKIHFLNWDISKYPINIDNIDLVIIKDTFIHLQNNIIFNILNNIKLLQPKYMLITEDTHYMNIQYDIKDGMYRPINITNYINNMKLIDEKYYYEITYIIYLVILSILTFYNYFFIFLIFLWIPKKRITLFENDTFIR